MAKTYTQNTLLGQSGINLIEKRVLDLGWVWNATGIEAGIDGYIEIREPQTGRATNFIIQVQSKSRSSFQNETNDSVEFSCDQRDLDYWLSGNAPVILILNRPSTDEAYWISVKEYFGETQRKRQRVAVFNKRTDKFDANARERLQALAVPRNSGIYLAAPPRQERLYSNLIAVDSVPPHIFTATTQLRDARAIRAILGYENAPDDWTARGGRLISFSKLDSPRWEQVVDQGTIDQHSSSDWSLSEDRDRVNEFSELLHRALRVILRSFGVAYYREGDYFYFTASGDRQPRRFGYRSFKKSTARTVFQAFLSKDEPGHVRFYRHAAFSGQFFCFEDVWSLAISPTYHFTSDGWERHRWYESKLKGIKALERNSAVLGQIVMWAALLRGEGEDLFHVPSNGLSFGELIHDDLTAGINEDWWLWNEEDDITKKATSELSDLPLFSASPKESL